MGKIQYENKVALLENADIPDINKVKADDMNEIKQVVNENDDKFLTNGLNVSNEVDEDYRVNFLKSNNLFDISNLKDLNNIASISSISNGVKCTNNSGGNTMILLVVKDVSNYVGKTFTFKANWTGSAGIVLGLCDANGGNRIQGAVGSTSGQSISYTIPTLGTAKYLYARLTIGQTQNDSANFTNIMLNEGNTALPYEPYVTPSIIVDNEEIYSKPVVYPKRSYTYKGLTVDAQRIGNICMAVIGGSLNETLNADTFYDITLDTELASIFDISMNFLTRNSKAGMLRITPTYKLRIYPYASMGSGEAFREVITYLGN